MPWMIGGHTIHLSIEGMLITTGIKPTPIQNSTSKVAGLQAHVTKPSINVLGSFIAMDVYYACLSC